MQESAFLSLLWSNFFSFFKTRQWLPTVYISELRKTHFIAFYQSNRVIRFSLLSFKALSLFAAFDLFI